MSKTDSKLEPRTEVTFCTLRESTKERLRDLAEHDERSISYLLSLAAEQYLTKREGR